MTSERREVAEPQPHSSFRGSCAQHATSGSTGCIQQEAVEYDARGWRLASGEGGQFPVQPYSGSAEASVRAACKHTVDTTNWVAIRGSLSRHVDLTLHAGLRVRTYSVLYDLYCTPLALETLVERFQIGVSTARTPPRNVRNRLDAS